MRKLIASIEGEFRRYKKLGDETMAQLQDANCQRAGQAVEIQSRFWSGIFRET